MAKVKYSKELLQSAVNKSYSIADVCRELNLKPAGGSYYTIHKKCQEYNIDISHFVGQAWSKNPNHSRNVNELNNILKTNTSFKSTQLKKRLIQAGLKEDKCEICGCGPEWNGKPITLQLHHMNANHYDNRLENLQVLCPNCHSQQESHKKPKTNHKELNTIFYQHKKELKKCTCMNCGKEFQADRLNKTRKFCSIECYRKYVEQFGHKNIQISRFTNSFLLEDLKKEMQNCTTITELARKLNSHRCTVREHLIRNGLYDEFMNRKET